MMVVKQAAPPGVDVPFLDLSPMHAPLREELLRGIDALLGAGAFTNGPVVASFEAAFAAYCQSRRIASASLAASTRSGSACSQPVSSRATR